VSAGLGSLAVLDRFLLVPDARLPAGVGALVTSRVGGFSGAPYGDADGRAMGMNLGWHVGDDPASVRANRERLQRVLPGPVHWLEQVHGYAVHRVEGPPAGTPPVADAAVTTRPGQVLAVMTADCLPVLMWAADGSCVGVAHAGWRGLAAGVIEATVAAMRAQRPGVPIAAWLGPAIGPDAYEVGDDVREAFVGRDDAQAPAFRVGAVPGKWYCDLYRLARSRLAGAGVETVGGGDRCTLLEPDVFYSHRRDRVTGRFASLLWIVA
jgi:polyphenol oxidase